MHHPSSLIFWLLVEVSQWEIPAEDQWKGKEQFGGMFVFLGDTAFSWQTIWTPTRPSNAICPPHSLVLRVITPPNIKATYERSKMLNWILGTICKFNWFIVSGCIRTFLTSNNRKPDWNWFEQHVDCLVYVAWSLDVHSGPISVK